MAVELGEQTVQVEYRAARITGRMLLRIMETLLHRLTAQREGIVRGEQSMKQLNHHDRALESVTITDRDMKAIRRELNRYGVDYAIMKEPGSDTHKLFFKGRDVQQIHDALQHVVADLGRPQRKPMKEVIKAAKEKAMQHNASRNRTPPEKEQTIDRGKEAR